MDRNEKKKLRELIGEHLDVSDPLAGLLLALPGLEDACGSRPPVRCTGS